MDREPRMGFPYTSEDLAEAQQALRAKAAALHISGSPEVSQQLFQVANDPKSLGAYLIFEQALEEQAARQL